MNRLVTSVLVLGTCGSIAACSSSGGATGPSSTPAASPTQLSAAAYRQQLKNVAAEESRAQSAVQGAFHAHTAAAVRHALSVFAADQKRVSDELSALVPPPDAQAANAALAHAFADNAAATAHVVRQLAGAPTAKAALHIIQTASGAQTSGHEIDAALARLRKLGYTAGS